MSGQHDGIIRDLVTYGSDEDSIDNDINLFLYFFLPLMVETTSLRKKRIFQGLTPHVTPCHLTVLVRTVLVLLLCVIETQAFCL